MFKPCVSVPTCPRSMQRFKKNKHQVARCRVVLGQSKKRPLVVENNLLHLRVVWYEIWGGWLGPPKVKKNNKLRSLWVVLVSFQLDLNIHPFSFNGHKKTRGVQSVGILCIFSGVFVVIFFPGPKTQSEDEFSRT